LIIATLICNWKGDDWENNVRKVLYTITNDSIPDFAKETLDEKGIPYVFYPEQNGITAGKRYNATIVCNYAIDYYNSFNQTNDSAFYFKFINCVDWLISNLTYKNNAAFYQFNWQQPWYPSVGAPYASGMTSGRAIEVFTYAYQLTKSEKFLQLSEALIRGFYIPIQSGGFTYKSSKGWWYEEIADTEMQTPRILDGHIFALTGLYKYWLTTKDDSAKYVIQKGLWALKQNLHLYDAGNGWSYYDINQKRSDKKYHKILTGQMKELWEISKDSLFLDYHKKWNIYFEKAYTLRAIEEKNISGIVLFLLLFFSSFLLLFLLRKTLPRKI
jgi:hypothetical protein